MPSDQFIRYVLLGGLVLLLLFGSQYLVVRYLVREFFKQKSEWVRKAIWKTEPNNERLD